MSSILHAADLHLGEKFNQYPKQFREALESYQKDCFRHLIDYAIEEEVEAILFAGDFFDQSKPKEELVHFVDEQLNRLLSYGIPFILALGNHDVFLDGSRFRSGALRVLSSQVIEEISFPTWILYGMSHEKIWDERRPAQLLSSLEEGYRVGLFHAAVGGGSKERYLPMDLREIDAMNFSYLALGHVHRPLKLPTFSSAYYSGAVCGTLQSEGGFYHYRFTQEEPIFIPSPAFPIKKMEFELVDLQRDLFSIEKRAKEELIIAVLRGKLHPKEKLMLEHWISAQEFPVEDRTERLFSGSLPPLLKSCHKILHEEMDTLLDHEFLGWCREEARKYFYSRREELYEELLSLYQGEQND